MNVAIGVANICLPEALNLCRCLDACLMFDGNSGTPIPYLLFLRHQCSDDAFIRPSSLSSLIDHYSAHRRMINSIHVSRSAPQQHCYRHTARTVTATGYGLHAHQELFSNREALRTGELPVMENHHAKLPPW